MYQYICSPSPRSDQGEVIAPRRRLRWGVVGRGGVAEPSRGVFWGEVEGGAADSHIDSGGRGGSTAWDVAVVAARGITGGKKQYETPLLQLTSTILPYATPRHAA